MDMTGFDFVPAPGRIYMVLMRKDVYTANEAKKFKDLVVEACKHKIVEWGEDLRYR